MKTEIYNLIILDESGSMSSMRQHTIDGCNETINTIISSQEEFAETQDHFISIFAFQSNDRKPSHYIVKNVPARAARHINPDLYEPWGGTPLYDAIGSTLTDLKAITRNKESAIGSVTIITDGYENASRHYDRTRVARMIDELKEMGWNFNFIGADIDVQSTAASLNIDNSLDFAKTMEGMGQMFGCMSTSRKRWFSRAHEATKAFNEECSATSEDDNTAMEQLREAYKSRMKDASADFFTNDEV